MSRYNTPPGRPVGRAVALSYGMNDTAPVVVASGMGYLAEKMIEVATEHGVPIYEDNSLATMLSQLALGQEIPESLYRAIVEIYVYFLKFDPNDPNKARRERQELEQLAQQKEETQAQQATDERQVPLEQ